MQSATSHRTSTKGFKSQPTSVPKQNLAYLSHLLTTRPLLFFGGVWIVFFLIAMIAVGSLLSITATDQSTPSAIAGGSGQPVPTQSVHPSEQIPLSLFGAIALTCTAGSFLLARYLRPSSDISPEQRCDENVSLEHEAIQQISDHYTAKQRKRKKAVGLGPKPTIGAAPQRIQPMPTTDSVLPLPIRSPQFRLEDTAATQMPFENSRCDRATSSQYSFEFQTSQPQSYPPTPHQKTVKHSPAKPAKSVQVDVVPADHTHPLDWGEARLADEVDLRKRRSIESWL